jgi:hypothetical protein
MFSKLGMGLSRAACLVLLAAVVPASRIPRDPCYAVRKLPREGWLKDACLCQALSDALKAGVAGPIGPYWEPDVATGRVPYKVDGVHHESYGMPADPFRNEIKSNGESEPAKTPFLMNASLLESVISGNSYFLSCSLKANPVCDDSGIRAFLNERAEIDRYILTSYIFPYHPRLFATSLAQTSCVISIDF